MKPKTRTLEAFDLESLNEQILRIDLDDLEVESLDRRIELSLAALFLGAGEGGEDNRGGGGGGGGCDRLTCAGYWPV